MNKYRSGGMEEPDGYEEDHGENRRVREMRERGMVEMRLRQKAEMALNVLQITSASVREDSELRAAATKVLTEYLTRK